MTKNTTRQQPFSFQYYQYYFIAAAAATAIAGILHLVMTSNLIGRAPMFGTFFLVAGLAQLFWVLPMIKRWGRIWYYIGIAGTIILMIIYAITRVPNPITGGRALPINDMGVATMVLEAVYIAITALIIAKEKTVRAADQREEELR
jgi:hypothetical protein